VGRCGTTTCTLGLFHYICLVLGLATVRPPKPSCNSCVVGGWLHFAPPKPSCN
jgi:hypothetical protein